MWDKWFEHHGQPIPCSYPVDFHLVLLDAVKPFIPVRILSGRACIGEFSPNSIGAAYLSMLAYCRYPKIPVFNVLMDFRYIWNKSRPNDDIFLVISTLADAQV